METSVFVERGTAGDSGSAETKDELSFSELFLTLKRAKKLVALSVLAATAASVVIAFLIPVEYTAEAVIMTPQQSESSLSSMAQAAGGSASGAATGLGLLSVFGLRNPSDLYVGILESRTIADALISKYGLRNVYDDKYWQQARKHLARHTLIKAGKDTLIHIRVSDRNASRAADLANAYVEQLSIRNSTVALTEASQRRLFFEVQLAKQKDLLADAEVALRDTQQSTGLLVPTGQAEVLLRSAAQLRAEILSREAQLAGLRTYASDENPRYQAIKEQIATLRSELTTLEKGSKIESPDDLPVGKLPGAALEYVRRYREVKYHELLYEALAKQFEAARLDEAKAAPLIQIIDKAVIPERKSWPPRLIIVLSSAVVALFGASLFAFYRDALRKAA